MKGQGGLRNPCKSRQLNDWKLDNVEQLFSRLPGKGSE